MEEKSDRKSLPGLMLLNRFGCWVIEKPAEEYVTVTDRVVSAVSRAAMLLVAIVVTITFYEVVMRYVFRSPTLWVNEMTLWLGSAIFLVSGMYAMQRRAHIRITAVYDISPLWLRKIFDIASVAVIVAYAALMIFAGFEIALETLLKWERLGTFWNPPVPATVKPLVLIATFFVALQAVSNLMVDTFGWRGFGKPRQAYKPQVEHTEDKV